MTMKALHGLSVWIALLSCLTAIWPDSITYSGIGGLLFVSVILILASVSFSTNSFLCDLSQPTLTETQIIKRAISLVRLHNDAQNDIKSTKMIVISLMAFNKYHGNLSNSVIMQLIKNDGKKDIKKQILLNGLSHLIHKKLQMWIQSFPRSAEIQRVLIAFLLDITKNYTEAWASIESLKEVNSTFTENYSSYCFKSEIKTLAECSELRNNIGLRAIVAIRQLKAEQKFKQLIENGTTLNEKFWGGLMEKDPLYDFFQEVGFKILETDNELEIIWKYFAKQNIVHMGLILVYSAYCDKVQEDSLKVADIKNYIQYITTSYSLDSASHASIGGGIITISALVESLGIIKQYNSAFAKISGYTKESIINAPVNIIIPPIYRSAHEIELLKTCVEIEAGYDHEAREKSVFLIEKSKYIVPVKMKVQECPSFANSYVFLASVNYNKELMAYSLHHIILDKEHHVICMSSSKAISYNIV